jgi:hypothetical protein
LWSGLSLLGDLYDDELSEDRLRIASTKERGYELNGFNEEGRLSS